MREIPANCILNKGITGCGATTLAIKQPGNTIIAVPFVELIQNKVHQIGDCLLGIYGEGDESEEIGTYIKAHSQIKIMTTYDSLEKVCSTLTEQGFNPYKEAHLIVDEWHIPNPVQYAQGTGKDRLECYRQQRNSVQRV